MDASSERFAQTTARMAAAREERYLSL